jgi:accessory gene regulator protein AgrB
MDKSVLKNIVTKFNEHSIEFNFDYYFSKGISILRGIFVYNADKSKTKDVLGSEYSKYFKFKKTLTWYLGDRKEIILLKLKDEIEISISDFEKFQVNNGV